MTGTITESPRKRQKTGSVIVAGLETALTDIRRRHPDVPHVVVTLAGSRRKWGHYAHNRWDAGGTATPELFIAGEGLKRGAAQVLETLLHESAHGIAAARQIQDTSRDGRYHNKRYALLAREVGLDVEQYGSRGWSSTSLPTTTIDAYAQTIVRLDTAIRAWREGERSTKPPSRNLALAVCSCERRIRVAPATFAQGPIVCGLCAEPFTVTSATSLEMP
jgi:hypothetical protein